MKKIYTSALALLIGLSLFAQNSTNESLQPMLDNGIAIKTIQNPINKAPGDTLWSEDFTGGFPTGWYTHDNTNNNYDWVLNSAAVQNNNLSPAGYTNTTAIASTSGGNHMLIFGDEYNRIATATGGTVVDLDAYFQTNGIYVNNMAGLSVVFQEKFRRCCANSPAPEINLVASTDSTFATNFQEYDINNGVATNTQSADPLTLSVNISAIAANYTGNIYLRFHIKSGTSHYFWMIDDIAIVESPINDMVTQSPYYGFTPVGTFGYEYTRIPVNHIQSADFSMVVENIGSADQTGTNLTVDISDGTSSVFNQSTSPITLNSLVKDTLEMLGAWTPPTTVGIPYTVTLEITSDSIDETPADNVAGFPPFEVSNYIFAIDDYGPNFGNGGPQSDPNGNTEHEIGNFFEAYVDDIATGVEFLAGTNSTLGTNVEAVLYRRSLGTYVLIGKSAIHSLSASDTLTPKTLLLTDPATNTYPLLQKDSTYFVAIHSFNDLFQVATSGVGPAPGTNSNIHSNVCFPNRISPTTVYGLSRTPVVRLSLTPIPITWTNKPANIAIDCDTSSLPTPTGTATATTTCATGGIAVNYTDTSVVGACANDSVLTRTWTATDNCGNSGTYVQTINIKDNTNPTITCPATQNQNAPNGTDTTLLDYTSMASISDNCSDSANITVTQFPAIGSTQNVGTTNVVLTAIDECGNFAICAFDVTITNTVGIAENKNVAVTIFPNPNKGLFTINLGTEISGKTNIQVYNVLGEIVYNVNKEDGNAIYELNLQHVDKGIYYVNVQGEQKTIVKKIMIM